MNRLIFLFSPTAFAGVVEGDGAERPGGEVRAGVGAAEVATVLARLGVVAVGAIDSVVEGAEGVVEEIETMAGSASGAEVGSGSSSDGAASRVGAAWEVQACAGSSSQVGPDAVVGSSHPAGSSLVVVVGSGTEVGTEGSTAGVAGVVTGWEAGREAGARVGAEGTAEGVTGATGLGGSLGL